ncbi:MAG: nucleoside deaminase [Bacteroidales bacterium]|nr:nucleoside deaminase [Bacteroidales bacterium]
MSHKDYIREAIRFSEESMEEGGGPFGAVIVKDNEIIARAGNTVTPSNDPTAHAEINAIRKAAQYLNNFDLSGCVIYSSCEPCPMCLGAIYWARLERIYFAAGNADARYAGFDDSFIYNEIKKPFAQRSIQTIQMLRDEAFEVLEKWRQKEDKIQY